MSENVNLKLEKIAKMLCKGVSEEQLASIMGVDAAKVRLLIESEEFKNIFANMQVEEFEEQEVLDGGWDLAESLAVTQVIQNLQQTPDPDYALKVAMVANKAVRKHGKNRENAPITVNANLQTVISLQPNYVKSLQNEFVIGQSNQKHLEQKIADSISPTQVRNILSAKPHGALEQMEDEMKDILK